MSKEITILQLSFEELESLFEKYSNKCTCTEVAKAPDVMTVDEVAEYLGVKPQTIYNYKNEGKIPYTKRIGLRFIKKRIDEWLLENDPLS